MVDNVDFCVLISIYANDSPQYLGEALQSIYLQTRLPEQVVLICDGPISIELGNVVKKYSKLFSERGVDFTNPILKNNVGLGEALRCGVGYCSKAYIVRMDSDDLSLPSRIADLNLFCRNNPTIDVVGTYIEEFLNVPGDLDRFRFVPLTNENIVARIKKRNPMNHVTVCIKRKSLIAVGNYEGVLWHEDYFLWMKMVSSGLLLQNLSTVSVYVRVSGLSGRRLGRAYIKSEIGFLRACSAIGMMKIIDQVLYISPRILFRILPSKLVDVLYNLLRKFS